MGRRYPALVALGFVIAGIVAADLSHLGSGIFLLIAFGGVVAAGLVAFRSHVWPLALVGLVLAAVSGYHFATDCYDLTPRHISRVVDETTTAQIFGTVADWPDLKANVTEFVIDVDSLGGEINRNVEGTILLKVTDTTTALQRGDRIEFYGRIFPEVGGENSGERFDYRRHLHLRGLFGIVYLPTLLDVRIDKRYQYGLFAAVDRIREGIRNCFYTNLSPQAAALAAGFLIGETRNIPVEVYQWFRDSGTLHLLAVSGSNVALVLLVIAYLLRPFGFSRRMRSALLLVTIVLFAMLSYGEPSVLRASIMASLVIIGRLLERRFDLNHVIAVTMLIILLWSPAQLYDVGFQLSFASAWGLVSLVPKVTDFFARDQNKRWYRWVAFPLIVSFIAQLCSTPLTAYYFGRIPIWTLAANLVIVPLVSIDVVGVLILLLMTAIAPILGLWCGGLLDGVMQLTVLAVQFFGAPSHAVLEFGALRGSSYGWWSVLLFYGFLVVAGFSLKSRVARRVGLIGLMSALVVGAGIMAFTAFDQQSEQMVLTRVPGGVAAIRYVPGSSSGDLILTGLAEKEYPTEERIIVPLLAEKGITRLRKLILLKGSFGALDDVVRLCRAVTVDSLWMPGSYRSSFADAIRLMDPPEKMAVPVSYFGLTLPDSTHQGYYLSEEGVLMRLGAGSLVLSGGGQIPQEAATPGLSGSIVVLGGTWRPGDGELQAIRKGGVRAVICSRFAQERKGSGGRQNSDRKSPAPCPVYDLSRQNELVLILSDSVRIAVH